MILADTLSLVIENILDSCPLNSILISSSQVSKTPSSKYTEIM